MQCLIFIKCQPREGQWLQVTICTRVLAPYKVMGDGGPERLEDSIMAVRLINGSALLPTQKYLNLQSEFLHPLTTLLLIRPQREQVIQQEPFCAAS